MVLAVLPFQGTLIAESVDDSCRKTRGIAQSVDPVDQETDSSAAEPYGVMMRESMMVRLPCRGSRPPTQDENREQPYLQKARTAVTSSSWKCLETSTVDEPITTWSWDFRNEDALRWLRIYQFDSNRFRQWVKTYWFTNLLNMVQNSNEIFQIGFLGTANNTSWPFYIMLKPFAFLF